MTSYTKVGGFLEDFEKTPTFVSKIMVIHRFVLTLFCISYLQKLRVFFWRILRKKTPTFVITKYINSGTQKLGLKILNPPPNFCKLLL